MNILLLGYGNPGRGDDGIGPILIERLEQYFSPAQENQHQISFLTAMQLQPEHVLDLEMHEKVMLVDAGMGTPAPFSFKQVSPNRDDSFTTHALSPWSLLAIYREILVKEPPPTFLLTIRGEQFSLGAPLSPMVRTRLEQALAFVLALLRHPDSTWALGMNTGKEDARAVPG